MAYNPDIVYGLIANLITAMTLRNYEVAVKYARSIHRVTVQLKKAASQPSAKGGS